MDESPTRRQFRLETSAKIAHHYTPQKKKRAFLDKIDPVSVKLKTQEPRDAYSRKWGHIVMKPIFILLAMAIYSVGLAVKTANQPHDQNEKVDNLFARWDKPDSPGCALAVIRDGKIVYKRGYGMADLERNIPITTTSVFDVGSVSKQFTAMSIALLARQGKISLDDDIRKYISEIPSYGSPITIRNLIYHTSGIRDYIPLTALMSQESHYTYAQLIDLLARQKGLTFKPGDEHLYSNSGYLLLSLIVRKAGGKSLRDFADENIFKPLGMNNSRFVDDRTLIVKNRALGYSQREVGSGYANNISLLGDLVG